MKVVVSISKPNQGADLGSVEIDDPEPGDIEKVIGNALEAARMVAPSNPWPLRIDIFEMP